MSHIDKQSTHIAFLQQSFHARTEVLKQTHRIAKDVQWTKDGGDLILECLNVILFDVCLQGGESFEHIVTNVTFEDNDSCIKTCQVQPYSN